MVHTEGKKPQGRVVDAKDAKSYLCFICGAKLAKLETETGKPYTKRGKVYYNLYWICLCPNGHGKFRVKETTYKMYMDGK